MFLIFITTYLYDLRPFAVIQGLAAEQRRPELIRVIHHISNHSDFTNTSVARWIWELAIYGQTHDQASEVCESFSDPRPEVDAHKGQSTYGS